MTNIENIRSHQKIFLEQQKQRTEPKSYQIEGVDIKVNPGVFPPATDTRLLAANIRISQGQRTLDLTTGSGIFSVIAGLQGASGIAVDINPEAVKNARENFVEHGVQMKAIESNLYEAVPDEQFDQIYANGPFFEGDITEPLDYACYGARKFMDGLLGGASVRLKSNGKLFVVMSAWSELDYFENSVKRNNLKMTQSDSRSSDDGERTYHLYEITNS